MANNFKPLMASTINEEFTNILMGGDGIRTDKAHDYYEVIERSALPSCRGCIGTGRYTRVQRADDVLKDVLRQLKKEGYIVLTRGCSDIYKGDLKATTYYLAGEIL